MKICKNIMLATICLAGSIQTNDVIIALDLASLLPKKVKRSLTDEELAQAGEKASEIHYGHMAKKFQPELHNLAQKQREKTTRAEITMTLEQIISLNENGEAQFLSSLQDKHHTMHLLNQLPSDSKITLTDSVGETMQALVSNLKKDLDNAIEEQHRERDQAAKKIQHHYRTHAENKRIADAKDEIKNQLYLEKKDGNYSIKLFDGNKRQDLEKLLNTLPKTEMITLETRNGHHSEKYSAHDIYLDIASESDLADEEDIK